MSTDRRKNHRRFFLFFVESVRVIEYNNIGAL